MQRNKVRSAAATARWRERNPTAVERQNASRDWKGYFRKAKERSATRPRPEHCECCGVSAASLPKALCYDHDHTTGEFRGWLCHKCNMALGLLADCRAGVQLLLNYLDRT
jgi:hypothetical protein